MGISKDKQEKEALESFLGILLAVFIFAPLFITYSVVTTGFILSKLWVWFVIPLGAPTLGLVHLYGLSLLISLITMRNSIYKEEREVDGGKCFAAFLAPWIILLVGWILHLIMGA